MLAVLYAEEDAEERCEKKRCVRNMIEIKTRQPTPHTHTSSVAIGAISAEKKRRYSWLVLKVFSYFWLQRRCDELLLSMRAILVRSFVLNQNEWNSNTLPVETARNRIHFDARTHTHTAHTHPHRNSFDKFWMKIYITATARYNSISHSERLCTLLRSVRWHITSWVTFVCAVVVHLLAHI